MLAGTAAMALSAPALLAADAAGALPGDHGKGATQGLWPANPPAQDMSPRPPTRVRAPSVELALKAAQAIAQGCKQYRLGVTIVNAEGVPILVYIPDGSEANHAYTALRKAYSAVMFKVPTSQITARAQQDPEFANKIKADPNLMSYSGGVVLKVGDEVIGAIGVSGAEPGHHDEECGLIGLAKIKSELK
jgi:uncharacterized protein GlcG (DUF336 family)